MESRRLWMMWWSGLFATATFVHALRVMTGLPVTIGGWVMPLWVSWVVVLVAGGISVWLVQRAIVTMADPPRQSRDAFSHHPKAPGQQAQPSDLPCCSTGTRPG